MIVPALSLSATADPAVSDAFTYLAVLLSIIIGLAMTQVLQAAGRLIRWRAHTRFYFVPLLWAALLLLIDVQSWWAMFGLRHHERWAFLDFLVVLLQTIALYMLAAVILPESVDERGVDLHQHYREHSTWFFTFMTSLLVISLVKDFTLSGHWPGGANLAFHLFGIATAVAAIIIRRPAFHRMVAVTFAATLTVYITLLFARLS